ncbi:UPF0676 protein [Sphaceloma murrayae]|uniref:UPF0676 protein n=1 Tax=Sphaceloma murrayae TaxID=2082308 RepID=A0A2K1QWA0_9PEZI|nr:UPF0676 protein [Sphaceloma murrayae]
MADIPIVDISGTDDVVAAQLLAAATDSGFAFIEGNAATGLSAQDVQSMFDLSASFFASPADIKEQCSINSSESGKNRGWLGMHAETLDPGKQKKGDFKEAFNFSPHDPPQPLSGPLSPRRDQLLKFQAKCHALCQRVLGLFAVALSIAPDWFETHHDMTKGETGSILRLLYYPSLQTLKARSAQNQPDKQTEERSEQQWQTYEEETDVRAGAHSDYGSVTLLFQQLGQPGLEILTKKGTWAPVPVNPAGSATPPILLNIGDLLSYWTNGLLKSTVHRVIFPADPTGETKGKDRYSMAYFCHPLDSATLVPVPSRLVQEMSGGEEARKEIEKLKLLGGISSTLSGDRTRVLTAKEHLDARLGATYGPPRVTA